MLGRLFLLWKITWSKEKEMKKDQNPSEITTKAQRSFNQNNILLREEVFLVASWFSRIVIAVVKRVWQLAWKVPSSWWFQMDERTKKEDDEMLMVSCREKKKKWFRWISKKLLYYFRSVFFLLYLIHSNCTDFRRKTYFEGLGWMFPIKWWAYKAQAQSKEEDCGESTRWWW